VWQLNERSFDRCALQSIMEANEEIGYTGMAVKSIDMYLHVLTGCYEYIDGEWRNPNRIRQSRTLNRKNDGPLEGRRSGTIWPPLAQFLH